MKHLWSTLTLLVMGTLVGLVVAPAYADEAVTAAQQALAAMHESLLNPEGTAAQELEGRVVASEPAVFAEANTLALLQFVSLLGLQIAPTAVMSEDGATASVTVDPEPIKLVMVKQEDQWKVDLKATLEALPEATRAALERMVQAGQPGDDQPQASEAPGTVSEVTDETFGDKVTRATGWVLVDFGADWCPPCKALEPVLKELAPEYTGKLTFLSLDVDGSPESARAYNVRGVPTMIIFQNGLVAGQHVGYLAKEPLKQWIDGVLAGTAAANGIR